MSNFIPYGRQLINEDDINAVVEALRAPFLTQGPLIATFEEQLAKSCGAQFAVVVSSGTAALHLSCLAIEMKAGDNLITSAITFVASANCALYCGADAVFTDIGLDSFNMSATDLARKIDQNTKAVVPVHMAGASCDMKAISEAVRQSSSRFKKKIYIIEDAAHALGGTYDGAPIGSCRYSDMAILSFHPVKTITTAEGGAILTNDRALYERLCLLRSHGITKDPTKMTNTPAGPWYYEQQVLGYAYRMPDIQCALGLSQLQKLRAFVNRRREIAGRYTDLLSKYSELISPEPPESLETSAHHLYIARIDYQKAGTTRTKVMESLAQSGIGTQVHYIPVYRQPYYQEKYKTNPKDFPNSEKYYETCLSLPIFPTLSNREVDHIVEKLAQSLSR